MCTNFPNISENDHFFLFHIAYHIYVHVTTVCIHSYMNQDQVMAVVLCSIGLSTAQKKQYALDIIYCTVNLYYYNQLDTPFSEEKDCLSSACV